MSRYLEARRELLPADVTDLAEQLAEAGYKVTGPRLAVLKAATARSTCAGCSSLTATMI